MSPTSAATPPELIAGWGREGDDRPVSSRLASQSFTIRAIDERHLCPRRTPSKANEKLPPLSRSPTPPSAYALIRRSRTDARSFTNGFRARLESAQEQWERLTVNLRDLIYWTDSQNRALLEQQPVGGDLGRVENQNAFIKVCTFFLQVYVELMSFWKEKCTDICKFF